MTREEAIEHLDTIGQYYSQDHSDPYDECERLTKDELDAIYLAIKALEQEPCYNPDEWCHDCKEYDHDKHCCPRFNRVIRNTVEEIKQAKTGHWIEGQTNNPNIHNILCSCCFEGYPSKGHANSQYTKEKFQWCPKCGARMIDISDIN